MRNKVGEALRVVLVGAGPLPAGDMGAARHAPGVANRLWHFLQPAAMAGHRCRVVLIDDQAPPLADGGGGIEKLNLGGIEIERLRAPLGDCKLTDSLAALIADFAPDALAGVGTLQAAATACRIAGDQPVWVDLFGDPLAEIQAKAEILGDAMPVDETLFVWRLMHEVLARADAFSTVSRRQADALLGQLLLAGRTGRIADYGLKNRLAEADEEPGCKGHQNESGVGPEALNSKSAIRNPQSAIRNPQSAIRNPQSAIRNPQSAIRNPQSAIRNPQSAIPISPIPCGLETLEIFATAPPPRAAWLAQHGLPADAEVALWSGGFNAWTDPHTLVEGVERAMDHRPRLRFVATGGPLPGYLDRVFEDFRTRVAASRHRQRFHALGWLERESAEVWLQTADLALLVDRPCAETRLGARNRLLYHAAARCPVVATRGSEVVREMEAAGALIAFAPRSADELAAQIVRLLDDPPLRRKVGEQSSAYVREHYLFEPTARPFLEFLRDPTRATDAGRSPETPGGWIARYLDVTHRLQEAAELEHYRSGRLSRLTRRLSGKERPNPGKKK